MNKAERREKRLREAREWARTYTGKHIARDYHRHFRVNMKCAAKVIAAIGYGSQSNLTVTESNSQIRTQEHRPVSNDIIPHDKKQVNHDPQLDKPDTSAETDAAKQLSAEKRKKTLERRKRRREQRKKQPVVPKRPERMRQAKQSLGLFQGENPIQTYRKKFRVDVFTAVRELGELGIITPEQASIEQQKEELRIRRLWQKRNDQGMSIYEQFPNSDDRFFFIMGYTSGGAPYGVTWEEMGLEPWTFAEDTF